MRNIKLILEYDGTNYSGWQSQANANAIQDVVSEAIEKMVEHKVVLRGASRTDAGVHALGQVAAFETDRSIPCDGFLKGLNALFPKDIRVKHCEEAVNNFHPTRDAKWKEYHYLLETGETPSALNRNRAWWAGPALDMAAMEEASRCLIGEHDFKSFQGQQADTKTTVRELNDIRITPLLCKEGGGISTPSKQVRKHTLLKQTVCLGPLDQVFLFAPPLQRGRVRLGFRAPGFLKYMIRNMVGTLVEVGQGKRSAGEVKTILESLDRRKAGGCAPACGLYLMQVAYVIPVKTGIPGSPLPRG